LKKNFFFTTARLQSPSTLRDNCVIDDFDVPKEVVMQAGTMSRPLMTLNEVAALCRESTLILHRLVESGRITPAVRGKRGTGHHTRFTLPQAYGLAFALALRRSHWGCSGAYADLVYETYGGFTDAELEAHLGVTQGDYAEEAKARIRTELIFTPPSVPQELMEAFKEACIEVFTRMQPMGEAIRRRLATARERQP
jgi:hypothetical protein